MPKEMLPLGGKVVLQHVIEECDRSRLDTLLIVLNRSKTALFPVAEETPCQVDDRTGVPRRSVYFANQQEQGGLAHALLHGEAFAGADHFVLALGDTVITGGAGTLIQRLIDAHLKHGAAATIAAQMVAGPEISRYGVFIPAEEPGPVFRVRGIIEKPAPEAAPSNLAITARYVFSPEIFDACRAVGPGKNGEIELTAAMTYLAERGRTVLGVRLQEGESRLDIGHPASYIEAFRLLTEPPGGA